MVPLHAVAAPINASAHHTAQDERRRVPRKVLDSSEVSDMVMIHLLLATAPTHVAVNSPQY